MEVTSLCHGCETTVSNRPTFPGRFGACADSLYQALFSPPMQTESLGTRLSQLRALCKVSHNRRIISGWPHPNETLVLLAYRAYHGLILRVLALINSIYGADASVVVQ